MTDADRTAAKTLMALYDATVTAAHPASCLPPHLPPVPKTGRIVVVGAGKAAAAMAVAAEQHYAGLGLLDRVSGFVTAPHGYRETLPEAPSAIRIIAGRHPTPDADSVAAAERSLAQVGEAGASDLVLVLLSGGASALWAAPASGIDIAAKTALTKGLLKCGADIHEMNTVRRHVSRIKGGRLRKATRAPMVTLAISDVPGDDPNTIGSGPTVPDASTLAEARAILQRRRVQMEALGLHVPAAVDAALADPANETPKPTDAAFADARYTIIATPERALQDACTLARGQGYEVIYLGDQVVGEAREIAAEHAALAREAQARASAPPSSAAAVVGDRAQRQRSRWAMPGICAGLGRRA